MFFGAKAETDPKIKFRTYVLQPIRMCLFLFGLFGQCPLQGTPKHAYGNAKILGIILVCLDIQKPKKKNSNSSAKLPRSIFCLARGTSEKTSKFTAELVWWFEGMVFVTPVPKNRPSTPTRGLFGSRVLKMACCLTWGGIFMIPVLKGLDLVSFS